MRDHHGDRRGRTESLAERVGAQLVHMDDLYLGWSGLEQSADRLREEILAPLWLGRAGRYRRYDWHAGELAEGHEVHAGGMLVVEHGGRTLRLPAAGASVTGDRVTISSTFERATAN